MTTVTLSWPDPESAAEFLRIRRALRDGPAWDADREHLIELVRDSRVKDGSEGSGDGG